jgi:hypothetical protein
MFSIFFLYAGKTFQAVSNYRGLPVAIHKRGGAAA